MILQKANLANQWSHSGSIYRNMGEGLFTGTWMTHMTTVTIEMTTYFPIILVVYLNTNIVQYGYWPMYPQPLLEDIPPHNAGGNRHNRITTADIFSSGSSAQLHISSHNLGLPNSFSRIYAGLCFSFFTNQLFCESFLIRYEEKSTLTSQRTNKRPM